MSTRLRVNLFWLGRASFLPGKEYALKLGTARVPARLESIVRIIDAAGLNTHDERDRIERHDVAECILALGRPLAFDQAQEIPETGRFVIVDDYEISGGGIVREALRDSQEWVRNKVVRRNLKWASGGVLEDRRVERFSQRPALLLITGEQEVDRKRIARDLELRLFDDGRLVYFLAIGNVLYGVDADLERTEGTRIEHIRRLGEVANILLDAGLIVIATAVALTQNELEVIRTAVGRDRTSAVWIGDSVSTDIAPDLTLLEEDVFQEGPALLKGFLQDRGVIFRPW